MVGLLIGKINSTLECTICSEIMHVPFLTECGHSFCYGCLSLWFESKINCPTCRRDMENTPILNIQLKAISSSIVDMAADVVGASEEGASLKAAREGAIKEYEEDFSKKRLFKDAFKTVLTLIDTSDGVPRCGNCHWEAHGSSCLHCGALFRTPREDSYYDTDDEDAYLEDEEIRIQEEEHPNEYDSEDSFVDNRTFDAIDRDLDLEDDILSSSGSGEWVGFDDVNALNSHEHSPEVAWEAEGGFEVDEERMHEVLDGLHEDHLGETVDLTGEDDDDITVRPRPQRVILDDDESE